MAETAMPRLVDFDDVVQFAKLVRFDVLVVRIGDPLAVDDETIAISARWERERGAPDAGLAVGLHGGGHGRPVVEIAGDEHTLGGVELGGEDDLAADLLDA